MIIGHRLAPIPHHEIRIDLGGGPELVEGNWIPEGMERCDSLQKVSLRFVRFGRGRETHNVQFAQFRWFGLLYGWFVRGCKGSWHHRQATNKNNPVEILINVICYLIVLDVSGHR